MPLRDLKLQQMHALGTELQATALRRKALMKAPELLVAFKRLDRAMERFATVEATPRIDYEARARARGELETRDQALCTRLRALWYGIEANAPLLKPADSTALLQLRETLFRKGLALLKMRRGERALLISGANAAITDAEGSLLKRVPMVGGTASSLLQTICEEARALSAMDMDFSNNLADEQSTLGGRRPQASRTAARNAWIHAILMFETLGSDDPSIAALNNQLLLGIRSAVAHAIERKKRSVRRKKLRAKKRAERGA